MNTIERSWPVVFSIALTLSAWALPVAAEEVLDATVAQPSISTPTTTDRCSTVTLYAGHNSQRRRNQTATDENHRSQVAAPQASVSPIGLEAVWTQARGFAPLLRRLSVNSWRWILVVVGD